MTLAFKWYCKDCNVYEYAFFATLSCRSSKCIVNVCKKKKKKKSLKQSNGQGI